MREKRNKIFGQGAKILLSTISVCVALAVVAGGAAYLFRQSEMETKASEDLRAIAPNYKEKVANPAESIDNDQNSDPTAYQTKEDKIGWSGRGDDEDKDSSSNLPQAYQDQPKPHEVGTQSASAGTDRASDQESGMKNSGNHDSDQNSGKEKAENKKEKSSKKNKPKQASAQ